MVTPGEKDVPFFKCFRLDGMLPALSDFCIVVLEEYGLLYSQLHPQEVLLISIFVHQCEGFIDVPTSVSEDFATFTLQDPFRTNP
jgi:hypothetical protein